MSNGKKVGVEGEEGGCGRGRRWVWKGKKVGVEGEEGGCGSKI